MKSFPIDHELWAVPLLVALVAVVQHVPLALPHVAADFRIDAWETLARIPLDRLLCQTLLQSF